MINQAILLDAEYQAVQDALMKCLQILTTESHQLKEQAGQ